MTTNIDIKNTINLRARLKFACDFYGLSATTAHYQNRTSKKIVHRYDNKCMKTDETITGFTKKETNFTPQTLVRYSTISSGPPFCIRRPVKEKIRKISL